MLPPVSDEQVFRPSLSWRLVIAFAVCEGATSLLALYERQLGPARIPVLIITACGSFYFLKLLLEDGWYDAAALPLERMIARILIFLQVLVFLIFLGLRIFGMRHL
jgi:hypothetical protein